jgi:hypothetical protein
MNLPEFLDALFEHGHVATSSTEVSAADSVAARSLLSEFESNYRLDLPDQPPAFSPDAALWAASIFYRACHFTVDRDANPELLHRMLLAPCPEPATASVHYSADVVLRFLPDVIKVARAVSPEDPLVGVLVELAGRWPMSSVGVAGVDQIDGRVMIEDPCLSRIYVDRVMVRKDLARLGDRTVRCLVEESLGMYPELASDVAEEIERLNEQERTA